jgi:hypothetical protein
MRVSVFDMAENVLEDWALYQVLGTEFFSERRRSLPVLFIFRFPLSISPALLFFGPSHILLFFCRMISGRRSGGHRNSSAKAGTRGFVLPIELGVGVLSASLDKPDHLTAVCP